MTLWERLLAMLNLYRPPGPAAGQEWLAVTFKLSDEKFGTEEEREMVHRFSDELASIIKRHDVGTFDGDEFGEGQGTLFMYGPNADKLFDAVCPALKEWAPLKGGYAIKRYGKPDERERIEF